MEKVERQLGPVVVDIAGEELTPAEIKVLQHPSVGMVILFTRNYDSIEQLSRLCHEIHSLRNPPLLIAVDQEGGRIQRFRDGFTHIPAMSQIGELYDKDPHRAIAIAADCGLILASELRACGVDFTFAPCLDLNYGRSAVIGSRSFHRDPDAVVSLATAFIGGLFQSGMACCGKHFPGHGFAIADSHTELPVDERDKETIFNNDEVAYRTLGPLLTAVMPAHIVYPLIDKASAGFSKKWLQEELRGKLGFTGMIFSDDLSMKGAAELGDITARSEAALSAGCDMILICNDPEGVDLVLSHQRWVRTKLFDDRLARIQPMGKFPSWASMILHPTYKACVKRIKEFRDELDDTESAKTL